MKECKKAIGPEQSGPFLFQAEGGFKMNAVLKAFREEHGCRYCFYYRNKCEAKGICVFDFLPMDALEEDVELFLIS